MSNPKNTLRALILGAILASGVAHHMHASTPPIPIDLDQALLEGKCMIRTTEQPEMYLVDAGEHKPMLCTLADSESANRIWIIRKVENPTGRNVPQYMIVNEKTGRVLMKYDRYGEVAIAKASREYYESLVAIHEDRRSQSVLIQFIYSIARWNDRIFRSTNTGNNKLENPKNPTIWQLAKLTETLSL